VRRPAPAAHAGSEGSVTVFVLLLTVCLACLLGLVANGGAVLSAREAAISEAEQAARAGAAVLAPATIRQGGIASGGVQAMTAAELFMELSGHPGTAVADGDTVTASVTPFRVPTPLLALVGIPAIAISATASATAIGK
jgi:hypothetical protein